MLNLKSKAALVWSGGLLPFLLALTCHAFPPAAQPRASATDRPALAFDQYLVDLGPVEPTHLVTGRFVFRNNSQQTIEIGELIPSCGCLQPQLDKRTYAPGEQGTFTVRVLPANEDPGPKEYYVDLRYHDSQPREDRVQFRVVLPERQVTVRPKAILFYQGTGVPTTRELTVTDYRGKSLTVTNVHSSTPLAQVDAGVMEREEHGVFQVQISVTVTGDCPPGRHSGLVTIETDDPDFPVLRVPIMIQGPGVTATNEGADNRR